MATNEPDEKRYRLTTEISHLPADGKTYYEQAADGRPTIHYNGKVYELINWPIVQHVTPPEREATPSEKFLVRWFGL